MRDKIRKISVLGLLMCLALILSYVDSVICTALALPVMKLGLANVVIVAALHLYGFYTTLALGTVKSIFSLLWAGRLSGLLYSLFGTVLSICAMYAVSRCRRLSLLSVSVCGAVCHTVGQLIAAAVILSDTGVWYLLPAMTVISCISGIVLYFPERSIIVFLTKRYISNV